MDDERGIATRSDSPLRATTPPPAFPIGREGLFPGHFATAASVVGADRAYKGAGLFLVYSAREVRVIAVWRFSLQAAPCGIICRCGLNIARRLSRERTTCTPHGNAFLAFIVILGVAAIAVGGLGSAAAAPPDPCFHAATCIG